MSIGRNREEQELTALLAKTLVEKEVMEPMGKIGWGHGSPPPPDHSGQPAPTEGAPGNAAAPAAPVQSGRPAAAPGAAPAAAGVAKADSPTYAELVATYESMRDPETGLIAKKYRTVDDAIKGSGHLAIMAKQSFTERDEARTELARLREENLKLRTSPAPTPGAAPVSRANVAPLSRAALDNAQGKLEEVLSSIAENGGILDAEAAKSLSKAQREVADAAADLRVQEVLGQRDTAQVTERNEWKEVDDFMSQHHPESAKFSDEVALMLQSDPVLQAGVNALLAQGDKIQATVLAWKSYERMNTGALSAASHAKAVETEADLAAREQVRKEQVQKARVDAGVITGSTGGAGVHENSNATAASREEIEAARRQMRIEGDAPGSPAAMRFREMIIGPSLDPKYFGTR